MTGMEHSSTRTRQQKATAVTVLGGTFAGVAAAVRLARVGHQVTLVPEREDWRDALHSALGQTLTFPAPWRDLFKKSGRPAAGALGLHGLELVPDPDVITDRGQRWYADCEVIGRAHADIWRSYVDDADAIWQALRPLGVEAEPTASDCTDAALLRAGLYPRRSLADEARTLRHPVLRARVQALADDPRATPAWLTSRLAIERTFGIWRLVDAADATQPASKLVDVLLDRLADRGVTLADDASAAPTDRHAVIDSRDRSICWRRPRPLRHSETYFAQFRERPKISDPATPGLFAASASSAAGTEPWAQLLSGALAAYAAHAHLTGEDIRPSNKSQA